MKERWLPIPEYEGFYEVSDMGNVRSLPRIVRCKGKSYRTIPARMMKLGMSGHPNPAHRYVRVTLCKNGKNYGVLVHRAVAMAFIPNPENKPQVNHLRRPKTNNALTNLEWATMAEDAAHAKLNRLDARGSHHPMAKLNTKKVCQMRQRRAQGWTRERLMSEYKLSRSQTNNILRGATWKDALKHQPLSTAQQGTEI